MVAARAIFKETIVVIKVVDERKEGRQIIL